MQFDVLTIFPEYFRSPLKVGLLGKAVEKGLIQINLINIRDYARDKHRMTDDRPFGGGEGMVMKPEPIFYALEALKKAPPPPYIILLGPRGRLLNHQVALELAEKKRLVLICGRYEGVDERIKIHCVHEELSIGDYVLFGGEVAALVIIEVISRLVPGVLGHPDSARKDSFSDGLLKYPQYTRPRVFKGWPVPEILVSGDHQAVTQYRRQEALRETLKWRPDLLKKAPLSPEDRKILKRLGWREEDVPDTPSPCPSSGDQSSG
ncbi:tRNA (guanosine(37)-N1)-methyltransferase TrmD [Thermosulfuriphilus sp.]